MKKGTIRWLIIGTVVAIVLQAVAVTVASMVEMRSGKYWYVDDPMLDWFRKYVGITMIGVTAFIAGLMEFFAKEPPLPPPPTPSTLREKTLVLAIGFSIFALCLAVPLIFLKVLWEIGYPVTPVAEFIVVLVGFLLMSGLVLTIMNRFEREIDEFLRKLREGR